MFSFSSRRTSHPAPTTAPPSRIGSLVVRHQTGSWGRCHCISRWSTSGRPVRTAQVGGPLGAYLPPAHFDTPLDYESFAARKAMHEILATANTAFSPFAVPLVCL